MPLKTFEYKTFGDGQPILANVHYNDQANQKPQAIAIALHSGGFATGRRDLITPSHIKAFVERNFVVVSPDYRLYPNISLYDGPIQDTRDAYHWCRKSLPSIMKEHLGIAVDGDRIVAFGQSAGGHLAMMLGLEKEKPRAILSFYGPLNLRNPFYRQPVKQIITLLAAGVPQFEQSFLDKVYDEPVTTSNETLVLTASGGFKMPPEIDFAQPRNAWLFSIISNGTWVSEIVPESEVDRLDPICGFSEDFPPTYFIHGEADQVVDVNVVKDAHNKLKAFGVETEMVVVPGQPHAFDNALVAGDGMFENAIIEPINFAASHV
ncbi:alpha/beta-hydrolase [Rhizodiscina lignyota]|uniref:Alpha/beta-hydrolase n=1 Tax=Rhizodiscina lignyota TaxID=1504668 RepID=A0A9P4M8P1_9PEZI|nr:alpha/beta-hydrolase [Rhizodiscina lignyota]